MAFKQPYPPDKTDFLKFLKNECIDKSNNLRTKAGRHQKGSIEQSIYHIHSNTYIHLRFIYEYVEEMTQTFNSLTAAISKLPTREEFKASKTEAKTGVTENTKPTLEEIKKYKQKEKSLRYIYGG